MTPRKGFTVWVIYTENKSAPRTVWLDKSKETWTANPDHACEFMSREDATECAKRFGILHQSFIAARHKTHLPEPDSII